mmetsp:Transcript_10094/g.29932  ORF Transcript_10094/g.29932 Transcript_10094/m.29932 type:complete len:209 (-) Transcript_10094:213-839(-)
MGADVNHLWPTSVNSPPSPASAAFTAVARVVLARTSEPPCFSVMDMPSVALCLASSGTSRSSYPRALSRGSHARPTADRVADVRAGVPANVMVTGQQTPGSSWYMRYISAARTPCAPARPSCSPHAKPAQPLSRASRISWWYAGWYSARSTRWPNRSCVTRRGGWQLASRAAACQTALPVCSPNAPRCSVAHAPSQACTASTSAGSQV